MALTDVTLGTAFDAEAGDVATLATAALKVKWFNEGQERLLKYKPSTSDITWAAAARTVSLPADFIELVKVVTDEGYVAQPWRVFGANLVIDSSDGALSAGAARLYYLASYTALAIPGTSQLSAQNDTACLYYALSRFYRRLASNRAYYKRYATMVGQNAVTMSDLQQEAERYYQDFLDAREDAQPLPPAFHYED